MSLKRRPLKVCLAMYKGPNEDPCIKFGTLDSSDVNEFKEVVRDMFQVKGGVKLSYYDDEDDKIPIDSNHELSEAYFYMKGLKNPYICVKEEGILSPTCKPKQHKTPQSSSLMAGKSKVKMSKNLTHRTKTEREETATVNKCLSKKMIEDKITPTTVVKHRRSNNIVVNTERDESPPKWFKKYMHKFKHELADELSKKIIKELKSEMINNEVSVTEEFANKDTPQTLNININSTPPNNGGLKKKKLSDEECSDSAIVTDQWDSKLLKKIEKFHKLGEKKFEKLDSKLEKLENKTKRLLEKKSQSQSRCKSERLTENVTKRRYDTLMNTYLMNAGLLDNKEDKELFVEPGEYFTKSWHIMNNGNLPWTDKTELRLAWGTPGLIFEQTVINCPPFKPGEKGYIIVHGQAPNYPGTFESYWHFYHMGERFGHWLDCAVMVSNEVTDKTTVALMLKEYNKQNSIAAANMDEIKKRLDNVTILPPPPTSTEILKRAFNNKEIEFTLDDCDDEDFTDLNHVNGENIEPAEWKQLQANPNFFDACVLTLDMPPLTPGHLNSSKSDKKDEVDGLLINLEENCEQFYDTESSINTDNNDIRGKVTSAAPLAPPLTGANDSAVPETNKNPEYESDSDSELSVISQFVTSSESDDDAFIMISKPIVEEDSGCELCKSVIDCSTVGEETAEQQTVNDEQQQLPRREDAPFPHFVHSCDEQGRVIYAVDGDGHCIPVTVTSPPVDDTCGPNLDNCERQASAPPKDTSYYYAFSGVEDGPRTKHEQEHKQHQQQHQPPVDILPNVFVNAASSAFSTARSVLNNIHSAVRSHVNHHNDNCGGRSRYHTHRHESPCSDEAMFALYEMGFDDFLLNNYLLHVHKNDMTKVVESLLACRRNNNNNNHNNNSDNK